MEAKIDLRIQKTYMMLHNAFTSLLEEKKFEEFTVNELCERAMIRRTTFYKHFADKYEYFAYYMTEISEEFHNQFPADTYTGNFNAYFIQMSRELLRFMKKNEKFVEHFAQSSLFPMLLNLLAEHISKDMLLTADKLGTSTIASSAKLKSTAAFYTGGLINLLLQSLRSGEPLDEESFIETVSSLIMKEVPA